MKSNFSRLRFCHTLKQLRAKVAEVTKSCKFRSCLRPFSSKGHQTGPKSHRELNRHYYDPLGKNLFLVDTTGETTGGCEI